MAGIDGDEEFAARAYLVADGAEADVHFVIHKVFLATVLVAGHEIGVLRDPAFVQAVGLIAVAVLHLPAVAGEVDILEPR